MVQFFITAVTGTFDTATNTDMEDVASLRMRMPYQTRHGTNSLRASHIRSLLHRVSLHHSTHCDEEVLSCMLIHQTKHAVVVESCVALRLLHRFLERRTGATLITVLVDEITTTQEILFIEGILQPHILHVHLGIGITHVDLGFPFSIGKAYSSTHVRNSNTRLQFVFIVLGTQISCIKQDST